MSFFARPESNTYARHPESRPPLLECVDQVKNHLIDQVDDLSGEDAKKTIWRPHFRALTK
jgi:hypothetical protein